MFSAENPGKPWTEAMPALQAYMNNSENSTVCGLRAMVGTIRPKWSVQLRESNARMGLKDNGGAWFTIGEFAVNPLKGWNDTMLWLHFYNGDVAKLFEPSDRDHPQPGRIPKQLASNPAAKSAKGK